MSKRQKFIFEQNIQGKEEKLKIALSEAVKKATAMNQPIVYRNAMCTKPNMFVHKYPNGQKKLIEQDQETSVEKTIMVLK